MTWNIIRLEDVAPTSWRNGGGTTRELMAWPDSVAWQWRVSVAEVAQSGPFSSFPGVKRWFAVLAGDGVCLTIDGHLAMLTKSDQPVAFDGAALTTCELLGGATQDFNLMVRGSASARMQRVNHCFQTTTNTPKIIAAYTHNDRANMQMGSEFLELSPHSFGWMQVDANTAIRVQATDALLIEINL